MNSDEAAEVLGVQLEGLTDNDVSIAFARAVKLSHPDTSARRDDEGLDKAKKARDTLREFIAKGGTRPACARCAGAGKVYGKVGLITCPNCNGKGHR